MTNIHDLSLSQLRRAIEIKEKIEALDQVLASLVGGGRPPSDGAPKKRTMSASARAKIRAGQKARWARVKGLSTETSEAPEVKVKKRKVSAAVKARLSEIAKKRWAKARAAGKTAL